MPLDPRFGRLASRPEEALANRLADVDRRLDDLDRAGPQQGFARDDSDVSTAAAGPLSLGGPKVTLWVPKSGVIAIYALTLITTNDVGTTGSVYAYVSAAATTVGLLSASGAGQLKRTVPGSQAGSTVVTGGFVIVDLGASFAGGATDVELQYGSVGGATSHFSTRDLWVMAPR